MSDNISINNRKLEKVKLHVSDLKKGMFICEIDRPWLETPFPLQGFAVESEELINEVIQYCEYVHIDVDRSKVENVIIDQLPSGSILNKKGKTFLLDEIENAETIRKQTTNLVNTFWDEIRYGMSPDIHLAKDAAHECVASMLRNPELMIFLVQLRSKDGLRGQEAFNCCVYSLLIGNLLNLTHKQLHNLAISALLHDMGKVLIPEDILNKTSKLTDEEHAIIQRHSQAGRDIIMSSGSLSLGTADVAYGHHENLDGSGYPRGLQGDQLSMFCKIVGVVDKYDAITSTMPFRPAKDHFRAIYILNHLAKEKKIDERLCSLLISYLGGYPPGSIVELTSKEVAIVVNSDPLNRQHPQVLVVRDNHREPCQRFVDLGEKTVDDQGRPYRIASVHRPSDFGIEPNQYFSLILQSIG